MAALMKRLAAATFICVCAEFCASHRSLSSFRTFFSYSRTRSCGGQDPDCCRRQQKLLLQKLALQLYYYFYSRCRMLYPWRALNDLL